MLETETAGGDTSPGASRNRWSATLARGLAHHATPPDPRPPTPGAPPTPALHAGVSRRRCASALLAGAEHRRYASALNTGATRRILTGANTSSPPSAARAALKRACSARNGHREWGSSGSGLRPLHPRHAPRYLREFSRDNANVCTRSLSARSSPKIEAPCLPGGSAGGSGPWGAGRRRGRTAADVVSWSACMSPPRGVDRVLAGALARYGMEKRSAGVTGGAGGRVGRRWANLTMS